MTQPAATLEADREHWYDAVCAQLQPHRLKQLLADLTNIHSPTGATRVASEYMAQYLARAGMRASYRPMNQLSGNVLAEVRGSGDGASLLLYSPIDTHLEADESDHPWVGRGGTVDLKPEAKSLDDWVFGLGASNPKAMVATICEVATAIVEADVPLVGDLMVGLADGGMPVNVPTRGNAGMSGGVLHLLSRGMAPDFAVIMKPWNFVYHEEPGMAWFKLITRGTLGYAGVPRGTPGFRSSIVPAATVILEAERWLVDYTLRNTSGQIEPQGWISALRAGWPDRPSMPSAVAEIYLDVRINPRSTPGDVKAQFAQFVADVKHRHPSIDLDWEMYGSTPGGTTEPSNWIIQSARRAWEHVESREHPVSPPMSGQTDGAMLRRYGIPTARIGWPWPPDNSPEPLCEGLGGAGATFIPDLMPCARKIAYTVVDTLTRRRADLGL